MFYNYITLSRAFNRYEKSQLIILLSNIFKQEGQDSYSKAIRDRLLAPNFSTTKAVNYNTSSNVLKVISPPPATTIPNIIRGINISYDKPVSLDSVESLYQSLLQRSGEPSPLITNRGVLLQASPKEQNKLQGVYQELGVRALDLNYKLLILINKVEEFKKQIDLLQKRAINYSKSTLVRAITSTPRAPQEFYD